ncbi:MAG TPA: D-alanyl-D-alanine carboxypeptidase [Ferruginibacter sp.]|jgi:D-alanyl-D-alanine carboxypeptidase/D-alanyl-D-alanine-endopeptidase (penicillin-binding protein 4)|nr:D-alanyl-D-alanine carboxypeptidase [Ferruginibacter sp.]
MKPNNYKNLDLKKLLIINYIVLIAFSSCSVSKYISHLANETLINDSTISTGHIGISIYEPATNTYLYNYDATKYFVPASNTKLFTLYAGMKYLGDSLVGLRYSMPEQNIYYLQPTGDPTLLDPYFTNQPVLEFLRTNSNSTFVFNWQRTNFSPFGKGWAWDDYTAEYMPERSIMPVYDNVYRFYKYDDTVLSLPSKLILTGNAFDFKGHTFKIVRNQCNNDLSVDFDSSFSDFTKTEIPFITSTGQSISLLRDTLKHFQAINDAFAAFLIGDTNKTIIHTQPTDSLFKPMMHNSNNFYAEQTLLMASNEHLGYMSDEAMIDTLLSSDLKDAPQKPKWVDGSGLSRYNLFTPQDFVYILNKMKNEFGLKRMEMILPTGGQGTLKNYYLKDSGFIYAKTGSLSNNNSLSGFLITKKNRLLIFSILANNFQGSSTPVRKAVEQFIEEIIEKN